MNIILTDRQNFVKHTTSDSECELVNRVYIYVVVQIESLP